MPSRPVVRKGMPLSERETEILQYVTEGITNEAIGLKIHLSPLTVKSHISRILRKLGASNKAHAVMIALRAGTIK